MKKIPLTQGFIALVDDADFIPASEHTWFAQRNGRRVYAARNLCKPDGTWTRQLLHSFILPEAPEEVDHRDGDGLNCQRENLRPATHAQNAQARCRKMAGCSSSFRGVRWHKKGRAWTAQICVSGKAIYLGLFEKETDAAVAYDSAAVRFFGEFASPNFPQFQFMSEDEDPIKETIDDKGN